MIREVNRDNQSGHALRIRRLPVLPRAERRHLEGSLTTWHFLGMSDRAGVFGPHAVRCGFALGLQPLSYRNVRVSVDAVNSGRQMVVVMMVQGCPYHSFKDGRACVLAKVIPTW